MTKNIIAEIEAARARTRVSHHYVVGFSLGVLKARVGDVSRENSEVLGYFAVSTVAHLEMFFRHALRDVLDIGEPFLSRSDRLLKDGRVSLDSTVAVALSGRRVTIGELIAASLGYSDLVRSAGYLTQVLDFDFLKAVREQYDTAPSNAAGTFDDIMAQLASVYDTRHIIAHEVRPEQPITRDRVLQWIEAAFSFAFAATSVIEPIVFPGGVPKTQAEAHERASEDAGKEIEGLESAYLRVSELSPSHKTALQDLLAAWRTWAQQASILASEILWDGGTMAPTAANLELQGLAKFERERLEGLVRALTER